MLLTDFITANRHSRVEIIDIIFTPVCVLVPFAIDKNSIAFFISDDEAYILFKTFSITSSMFLNVN